MRKAQSDKPVRRQGGIKLQFEGSPGRGGDSLSLEFHAQTAGDKLSPPRRAELDAALVCRLERPGGDTDCPERHRGGPVRPVFRFPSPSSAVMITHGPGADSR